ncbi:Uncharacterized conserved protein, DUF2147 family [Zobellia uliginosa]|uniref:Uncharacterized conserved protein, DUF2147 family n=1 Tax=Zobellia uliginosa TaxID=143224 RepID=A0ABY1KUB1_9FLAO|nr:DUF2147 domain-containing protein [Zobellia uliginosa]MDO6517112.1 DUF2147 domain-containing protein [Zobellia uliginosa]SIS65143.1 Uncharacterized conserved protein, DUF2147 family [Zobellia uliginosa]
MSTNAILSFFIFFIMLCPMGRSQGVFGKWKTIDDRTGKPKAIIEIYEEDGKMHGKVIEIVEEGKENFVCTKCEGDLKDKPVLGMTIIEGAEHHGNGVYKGDRLFDPQQAMTFRCKIWLNPDNPDELKVRGYLAFIYRTQTWIRVDE